MVNNQSKNQNQNSGGTTNQKKRRFYLKPNNNKPSANGNVNGSSQKVQSKQREYKFHMHDAQARKFSESFGKIENAILLKIQESFEDSEYIIESLKKKSKKVIEKPDYKKYRSSVVDPAEAAAENESLR